MPSPFPGMDPYIEAPRIWTDFHGGLAAEIRASLNRVIRPRYYAGLMPDVMLELFSVEIRKAGAETLITSIEILSPVNKQRTHSAHLDYLRKRSGLLGSAVHLMEIDLLRAGLRPPLEAPIPKAPYYVTLSRVNRRSHVSVWPLVLNARLPVIPVPLLEPEPDVPLDLGEVVASVYERGGYDARIDYAQPVPPPALSAEESTWVQLLLKNHTS
ncbi:MAG: DUF4058 family protein [Caldilineaceae bacterium]